ncbi:DNA processing protein DprA [Tatumella morbirosei]|uniref:DNA processing protein DprA n=1 Tax=Tatumella morbirosei TaxID=642227 RepID=A0A095TS05_9GAMM|nr:DNA-protecting protein DprA [Tatumella morbirosei]KGD79601.2 DNA processing protein DprA [Tatumella morbirosei]
MDIMEKWLRLGAVHGLKYPVRVEVATRLEQQTTVTYSFLRSMSFSEQQCRQFLNCDMSQITLARQWLEADEHYFLTLNDPGYPRLLAETSGCPLYLFVAGDPEVLSSPQIAIVGSRQCSRYGQHWTDFFAGAFSVSGFTLTSGLAVGIDSVAHRAALASGGKTIAVLGSGLLNIYPRQHQVLSREIIGKGGALVSEFPLNSTALPGHFPRRNRIISGLSLGVLVTEARMKSGSLITARYALEQNRNVYALPGPVAKPESEGTHWLIQQGALLVSHPNDVLEDLQVGYHSLRFSVTEQINSSQYGTVPLPFAGVLANVEDEVTPVDVVAERAGQPVPVIAAILLELELAGWIAAVPGGYVRLRRACHVRRTYVLV